MSTHNKSISNLEIATQHALTHRPKIGGFPYLAECLKQAGVLRNIWSLPSLQSIYVFDQGSLVNQGTPLIAGMTNIAAFNEAALITALRADQAGKSTFLEFLTAAWQAGVISYEVDFSLRTVSYFGAKDEKYTENYPEVEVLGLEL